MLPILSLLGTIMTLVVTTFLGAAVNKFNGFMGWLPSIPPPPVPPPSPPPPVPQANWTIVETWDPPTISHTITADTTTFLSPGLLTWSLVTLGFLSLVVIGRVPADTLRLPSISTLFQQEWHRATDALLRILHGIRLLGLTISHLGNLQETLTRLECTVASLTDRLQTTEAGLALALARCSEISGLQAKIDEQKDTVARMATSALDPAIRDDAAKLAVELAELRADIACLISVQTATVAAAEPTHETAEEESASAAPPPSTATSDTQSIVAEEAAVPASSSRVSRARKTMLKSLRAEGDALQARVDKLRRDWWANNPKSIEFAAPSLSGMIERASEAKTHDIIAALKSELSELEKRSKAPLSR